MLPFIQGCRLGLKLVALVGVLSEVASCAPSFYTSGTACLVAPLDAAYRSRADLALARRQLRLAEQSPRLLRARLLESLPSLFPDLSDRGNAPECSPELVQMLAEELEQRPLEFDNATLHFMNALGGVSDTTDIMSEKARLLLDLARIPDTQVLGYASTPFEAGPDPQPRLVRERAIWLLARSNLFANDRRVRAFLTEQARHERTPQVQIYLIEQTSAWLGPDERRAPLHFWLRDAERRLNQPASPWAFEALLSELNILGADADRQGLQPEVTQLLERVLNARGPVPATDTLPGAAYDLAVRAQWAKEDLLDGEARRHRLQPEEPLAARVPVRSSDSVPADPKPVVWTADAVAPLMKQLDVELHASRPRRVTVAGCRDCLRLEPTSDDQWCWLLEQKTQFIPQTEAEAWFYRLWGDASLPVCARRIALTAHNLPSTAQQHAASTHLTALNPDAQANGDSTAPVIRWALTQHPEWLAQDAPLRRWVITASLSEPSAELWSGAHTISGIDRLSRRAEYQMVLEHALSATLSTPQAAPSDVLNARKLMLYWAQLCRDADGRSFSDTYSYALRRSLLFGVARFAPALGLQREAQQLINDLSLEPREQRMAQWVMTLSTPAQPSAPGAISNLGHPLVQSRLDNAVGIQIDGGLSQ